MPGGFRSFANDINSKGPGRSIMPTYDNFKQDFKGSPGKVRKPQKDSNQGDMFNTSANKNERTKDDMAASASEGQQWEKYFYDLNQKVKSQRETIRNMDDKQSKFR